MAESRTRAEIEISAVDRTKAAFASVRSGLSDLGQGAEGIAGKVEAISGAFAALAGVAALGGLAAQFQAIVNGIDAFNDLSDATGASIEGLSQLEDTALRTGTSFDTAGSALIKLNQALNNAKPDSPIAKALQSIGLTAEQLKTQDPVQALETVARALSGYADDADKARLVQELFGRSARELAPLLKDLADRGLGVASVTREQALEAEKFNQQLAALRKNALDAARTFAGELVPSLNEGVARFVEASRELGILGALLELGPFGSPRAFNTAADQVAKFSGKVAELREQRKAIEGDQRPLISAFNEKRLAALDQEIAKAESLERLYRGFARRELPDLGQSSPTELARRGRGPTTLPFVGGSGGDGGSSGAATRSKLDSYTDGLRKQLEATQELSGVEKVLRDIRNGSLGTVTAQQERNLVALATEIDATKEAFRIAKERAELRKRDYEGAEAEIKRINEESYRALAAEGRRAADAILSPSERLTAELNRQAEILAVLGPAYQSTYDQYTTSITQAYLDGLNVAESATAEISEFAKEASRNIQDALGETVFRTLKGDFASIGQLWADTLLRMVAQAQAARLNEALLGKDGTSGLIGSALASLFSGGGQGAGTAGGAAILPQSLRGGAATGANVLERDMVTLVHRGEAIVPRAYNPALGGSRVTVNNYSGAEVQTRQRDDGGLDIDILTRAVEQRMAGNVASSRGPMAGALKARGLNSTPSLARMG